MEEQLKKKVKKMGCTMKDDGKYLRVDPPRYKVFIDGGSHGFIIPYGEDGWNKEDVCRQIIKEMNHGLKDCNDPFCPYCRTTRFPIYVRVQR